MLRMKDDDGEWVSEGDYISFSYGIPPVFVRSEIVIQDGKLMAFDRYNSQGHDLLHHPLRLLRGHVGNWYKSQPPENQG